MSDPVEDQFSDSGSVPNPTDKQALGGWSLLKLIASVSLSQSECTA